MFFEFIKMYLQSELIGGIYQSMTPAAGDYMNFKTKSNLDFRELMRSEGRGARDVDFR